MADVEELRAFEEERPLLGEPRLERREVDFGGIGFDLTEVGIDRRVSSVRFGPRPIFMSAPTRP